MFYAWLQAQRGRADVVGRLAHRAATDPLFPRHTKRLHLLLTYGDLYPEWRESVKIAHAEWRRAQRGAA